MAPTIVFSRGETGDRARVQMNVVRVGVNYRF